MDSVPVCVFSIPAGGGATGDTLADFVSCFPEQFASGSWSLNGTGYLTVPCDGTSPEVAAAIGCQPVSTVAASW